MVEKFTRSPPKIIYGYHKEERPLKNTPEFNPEISKIKLTYQHTRSIVTVKQIASYNGKQVNDWSSEIVMQLCSKKNIMERLS